MIVKIWVEVECISIITYLKFEFVRDAHDMSEKGFVGI